ncbi:MAG: hypothetical protein VZQ49_00080 [Methanobrevibacter sp.]|nr:hypothetical protein [Methanobrevibacter sp.]
MSTLGDPFYQNEAILGVKEASDTFLEGTSCDLANEMDGKMFICEHFNDGDNLNGRHTHNNLQDYWCFAGDGPNAPVILDIDFNINPRWLINSVGTTYNSACKNLKYVKALNFKSDKKLRPAQGYDINDHSILLFSYIPLQNLFENCYNVEEINGLDLTDTQSFINTIDPSNDNTLAYNPATGNNHWFSEYGNGGLYNGNCAYTFSTCWHLNTLNITWPNTLYTTSTKGMFFSCESLPDNQIPTFDLRPIYIPYTVADSSGNTYLGSPTIDISEMFHYCRLVSTTHLSAASWAYINNTQNAWAETSVHSIDIPATATNLINVADILGASVTGEDDGQGGKDYSNCKYIIRTTAPMTAKLNGVDGVDCRLFDFSNYENQNFYDTFGGIYVPDTQLQNWKDMISNEYGASNVAANCVHGLSDLQ